MSSALTWRNKHKGCAEAQPFKFVEKGELRFTIQVQQKIVTQIEISPKMVFADNLKGENDMSHYKHLTIEEREKLYLLKGQGKKVREIARELGRAPST
ncbi:MAG: helix-turn-helix domain-containing protein, partial [Ruminiclostridium sp.]|nr:helix-turn-helix domain-containing protein [Ruminiclostridium sp.]